MGAFPTLYNPTAGDKMSASQFDAGTEGAIAFLASPPRCSVYDSSGTQSIPNTGVLTLVIWDTESEDTDGMHTGSSSLVTIQTPGRYEIKMFFSLAAATFTQFDVNPRLNAAGSNSGGTSLRTFSYGNASRQFVGSFSRLFVAGDTVEFFVAQASGAARILQAAGQYSTGVQFTWIGLV